MPRLNEHQLDVVSEKGGRLRFAFCEFCQEELDDSPHAPWCPHRLESAGMASGDEAKQRVQIVSQTLAGAMTSEALLAMSAEDRVAAFNQLMAEPRGDGQAR